MLRLPRFALATLCALSLGAVSISAARAGNIPLDEPNPPHPKRAERGSDVGRIVWTTLMYLPNRLFDLTDVVRVQVRAGPGWALSARATRYLPLFVGDYTATWVGLPGPRGRARVPVPFGIESQRGFGIGPAFAAGGSQAPSYGAGEIGAGIHFYMIGFDVGFDVAELGDFFAGFACIDPEHDDF
ncbi:MAG TPA: hypothetical protein VMR50_21510 [Myxococcota bacterium]|nr:hypothetical protein [Myxococcota bacterium]